MPGHLVKSVLALSLIGPAFLLLALALAGGAFSRRAYQLYRFVRLGRPVQRFHDLPKRVEQEVTVVLGQRKLLQRLGPGLMHAFIFWGFLILLTTIAEAFGEVVQRRFAIPFIGHSGWLGLIQDVFAVLVIAGVGMAVFIRKIQRPERFKGSHLEEADFILLMILGIILTLLALNGTKIALAINESPRAWTPVSNLIAQIFEPMSRGAADTFEHLFLWAHILLILGFLAYIPYSKHLHIFVSEINVFFTNTRARGHLEPMHIDLETTEGEDVRLGAATVEDLTWKEILDTYSCTECGRCQSVCPAWNTGKPLSPKLIVMNLRDHLFQQGPLILEAQEKGEDYQKVPLNPDVIEDEVVWDCVTCGACMQECPVNIEHVDHIVDMRRNLVMGESRFPAEAGTLLRNL
ncbi:MAG TPA: 4Fe-4S dicluster domain-containing protein, partial [Actinomycetota bacterium]|nr:4Fe-4S dicluster domain-containing protein [Actinomycetota bacterium]